MKKAIFLLLYIIAALPLLCGCGSVFPSRREVERLLVIQTMGIDRDGEGVELSLASAADRSNGPMRLSGRGESVTSALSRIGRHCRERDLFSAHIGHVVIGEEAARDGLESVIAYICRSPDIRIDVPLYVVRGGAAAELVLDTGDESVGASEILKGIQTTLSERGELRGSTAAEAARALDRYGSALLCALELSESAEADGDGSKTASVCGCAVIRNGALCAFLDREETIAAELLMNRVGVNELVLTDHEGRPVTLELERGEAGVYAVTDERGELTGLDIQVKLSATVAESEGEYAGTDYLTARLEEAVSESICAVLNAERTLGADFLALSGRINGLSDERFREPGSLAAVLPELELRVSVGAKLTHTNDIRDT